MIHWTNLLWIVPVSASIGLFLAALLAAAKDDDRYDSQR